MHTYLNIIETPSIIIISVFFLNICVGCVSTKIEGHMNTNADTAQQGKVTVLAHSYASGNATEKKFIKCITKRLHSSLPQESYMDSQQFVDEMYPWFEPKRAPIDIVELRRLLEKPIVAAKIEEVNIRYIVLLAGHTQDVKQRECGACAVTPILVGLPGFGSFKKQSNYVAQIWDLKKQETVVDLNARGSGTTYMTIVPVYVLPILMGGNIRTASCKQLTEQLNIFFTGA